MKATLININYGKNRELMERCKPLMEYSLFIDRVRKSVKKQSEFGLKEHIEWYESQIEEEHANLMKEIEKERKQQKKN